MSDHTELKRLAELTAIHGWYQLGSFGLSRITGEAEESFVVAASPAAVLALIAENERLEQKNANQSESIREYQDLVMGGDVSLGMLKADIRVTTGERDQLKAENIAALREATDLAMAIWRRCYAKDSPNFQPFEKASSVIGQIDNMTAGLMSDLEKLRAEIAGLKTGYEAYERVNAELKAEVEALVSAMNEILRVTPMGVEAFGIAALVLGELSGAALGQGEQS